MNFFRLLGDWSHLLAILSLIVKISTSKCCLGISGKSQILYLLVFITRYLDLFTNFISVYNSIFKVSYIVLTITTCLLIFYFYRETYLYKMDSFRIEILLIPCLGLALGVNHDFSFMEITWTFSIYLESVVMLPQMWMIRKSREVEIFTSHYLSLMALYRALYIANWVYRYNTECFFDLIAIGAGVIQTLIYIFFLTLCCLTGVKPVQYQLLEV